MEVAEVTIQENDDPRGILQFSVSEVSTVLSLIMTWTSTLQEIQTIQMMIPKFQNQYI